MYIYLYRKINEDGERERAKGHLPECASLLHFWVFLYPTQKPLPKSRLRFFWIVLDTTWIASKLLGLAAANHASMTLTPSFSNCLAILTFSSLVIDAPGL